MNKEHIPDNFTHENRPQHYRNIQRHCTHEDCLHRLHMHIFNSVIHTIFYFLPVIKNRSSKAISSVTQNIFHIHSFYWQILHHRAYRLQQRRGAAPTFTAEYSKDRILIGLILAQMPSLRSGSRQCIKFLWLHHSCLNQFHIYIYLPFLSCRSKKQSL